MTITSITTDLELASSIITEMESLMDSFHRQCKFNVGDDTSHMPYHWLRLAYSRYLSAKNYVGAIDPTDYSAANQHRARRAIWLCTALEGAVRALIARAYLKLSQRQPAHKKYKALREQSLAYSQVTLGGNWEYYVPALLIWEDCELPEHEQHNVLMLLKNGEAALNYALALKSQLEIIEYPGRADFIVVAKALKSDHAAGCHCFFGESAPYELPRVPSYMEDRTRFKDRSEVENAWGCYVYDEAREASWLRIGSKWSHDNDYGQPKDRIVGFQRRHRSSK